MYFADSRGSVVARRLVRYNLRCGRSIDATTSGNTWSTSSADDAGGGTMDSSHLKTGETTFEATDERRRSSGKREM